jgi:hypothetical protein
MTDPEPEIAVIAIELVNPVILTVCPAVRVLLEV